MIFSWAYPRQPAGVKFSAHHEGMIHVMITDHPKTTHQPKPRIPWYRTPLDRDTLAALNQRSDWKGLLQAGGHLGLLAVTAAAAWVAADQRLWPALLLALFVTAPSTRSF